MINYRLAVSLSVLVLLVLPVFSHVRADHVRAEDLSSNDRGSREIEDSEVHNSVNEERITERKTEREVKKNEIEEKKVELEAKRATFQQDIAKRRVDHVSKVISATIRRLERIIERIESRIAKFEEKGAIVTDSLNSVALTKSNLSDARIALEALATIDISGETAQENFDKIREVATEAKAHLREAHSNLTLAVRSLRAVRDNIETGSEE